MDLRLSAKCAPPQRATPQSCEDRRPKTGRCPKPPFQMLKREGCGEADSILNISLAVRNSTMEATDWWGRH
jgi:hypothetical protein